MPTLSGWVILVLFPWGLSGCFLPRSLHSFGIEGNSREREIPVEAWVKLRCEM